MIYNCDIEYYDQFTLEIIFSLVGDGYFLKLQMFCIYFGFMLEKKTQKIDNL